MRAIAALFLLALAVVAEEQAGGDAPVVITENGEISGLQEKSTKGKTFYSYYGIPYAKPPVGELRFKDPVKTEGWSGVRNGTVRATPCTQGDLHIFVTGISLGIKGQEDCLYLNVYTPKPSTDEKLPVMVFIHGGAYIIGSALEYPPNVLLNHDIVLVVVQYRLGILGFLSTEDDMADGNQGLKDQVLALKWVQDNIHNFGGDPLEVTLFGESAGAGSAHLLMLSPYVLGLFKRVILQSGSAMCPWAHTRGHLEVAKYTANHFKCPTDQGSEEIIKCLQTIDHDKLVSFQEQFNKWFIFPLVMTPRVDGKFIPHDPEKLMREGRHKKIDIISGLNLDEGAMISNPLFAVKSLNDAMAKNFVESTRASFQLDEDDLVLHTIVEKYLGKVDLSEEKADNFTRMYSDRLFKVCQDLTSLYHARNTARLKRNVFAYELTHRGQRSLGDLYGHELGKRWVSHADELFYLFEGGRIFNPLEMEEDLKLRDIITTLWTNFAATGNPTPDNSLGFKWEPVKGNTLNYLALNTEPSMEEDYRQEVRDFWASLPTRENKILFPERVKDLFVGEEPLAEEEVKPQLREASKKEEQKETKLDKEDQKKKDEL